MCAGCQRQRFVFFICVQMNKFIIILCIIILSSCSALKWKNNYIGKRFAEMKRYNVDTTNIVVTVPDELTGVTKIRRTSKRKIRIIMDALERGAAMVPDSVGEQGNSIDSFYSNPYKIRFIKESSLGSANIHF